jgi:hypothetical protein
LGWWVICVFHSGCVAVPVAVAIIAFGKRRALAAAVIM